MSPGLGPDSLASGGLSKPISVDCGLSARCRKRQRHTVICQSWGQDVDLGNGHSSPSYHGAWAKPEPPSHPANGRTRSHVNAHIPLRLACVWRPSEHIWSDPPRPTARVLPPLLDCLLGEGKAPRTDLRRLTTWNQAPRSRNHMLTNSRRRACSAPLRPSPGGESPRRLQSPSRHHGQPQIQEQGALLSSSSEKRDETDFRDLQKEKHLVCLALWSGVSTEDAEKSLSGHCEPCPDHRWQRAFILSVSTHVCRVFSRMLRDKYEEARLHHRGFKIKNWSRS